MSTTEAGGDALARAIAVAIPAGEPGDMIDVNRAYIARCVAKSLREAGWTVVEPENAQAPMTAQDLRRMMRDPRYWRLRDPVYVKRVTDGFRQLFGKREGGVLEEAP